MDVNRFGASSNLERKVIVQRNSPIIFSSDDNPSNIYGEVLLSELDHNDLSESHQYFIEEEEIDEPQTFLMASQLVRQVASSPIGLKIGNTNIVPFKQKQETISNHATTLPGWPDGATIKVLSNTEMTPSHPIVLKKVSKPEVFKRKLPSTPEVVTYTQVPRHETYHIITNENDGNCDDLEFQLQYQNEHGSETILTDGYEITYAPEHVADSIILEDEIVDEEDEVILGSEPAVEEYPEEYLEEEDNHSWIKNKNPGLRTKREQQEAEIEAMRQHIARTSSLMKRTQYIEELDVDYFSIWASDFLRWSDGIGYMRESGLHFEFNSFGMIEVLDDHEYYKHIKTNVHETLKEPLQSRATATRLARNKRKLPATENLYKCRTCKSRGPAQDFVVPDYCSVACLKDVKGNLEILKDPHEKFQYNPTFSFEYESETSNQIISEDESYSKGGNFISQEPDRFCWDTYLKETNSIAAPNKLFMHPYPKIKNNFKIGMKLEAIDPENASFFCVCSVVEIRGFRLKLNFDGYSNEFDFWVNADSIDIYPPCWCKRTGRTLLPPFGQTPGEFMWKKYLSSTHSLPASSYLFAHTKKKKPIKNKFKVGMCLEADDLKASGKIGIVSVIDKIDHRILVRFDGGEEQNNYWVDIDSPYIHPVNWHKENNCELLRPKEWEKEETFDWIRYFERRKCKNSSVSLAGHDMFSPRVAKAFKIDMKLEVVDRKNPMLIRPATVVATDGFELKVCYDGWPAFYSFWIEDNSTDIHPINWCYQTGHPIEFPPNFNDENEEICTTCEMKHCNGLGNVKDPTQRVHSTLDECPYEKSNWLMEEKRKCRIVPVDFEDEIDFKETELPQPTIESANDEAMEVDEPRPSTPSCTSQEIEESPQKDGPKIWRATTKLLDLPKDKASCDIPTNPLKWNTEEVAAWIEKLPGCSEIGKSVRREEIDGTTFLSLTRKDLQEHLDIKMGPAIKVYDKIRYLRETVEKNFITF